jgi:hypothetical protein
MAQRQPGGVEGREVVPEASVVGEQFQVQSDRAQQHHGGKYGHDGGARE